MLFREQKIDVVAASADPIDRAREVAEGMRLSFPVAYGIDAEAIHGLIGATLDRKNGIVQPAAFVLKPDRTVAVTVYSSWAVGRLRPDEVYGTIHYLGRSGFQ